LERSSYAGIGFGWFSKDIDFLSIVYISKQLKRKRNSALKRFFKALLVFHDNAHVISLATSLSCPQGRTASTSFSLTFVSIKSLLHEREQKHTNA
jgi:hypothetical protein